MKKHQTTWGGLLAVLAAMATGVTFGAENFPVARGTIVFHVVDERGEAVEGATCSAWFIKNDSLFSQKEVRARTDGEGNARLQGKTNGEVVFHVEKEGFWMTRGRYWMYRSPFAPVGGNRIWSTAGKDINLNENSAQGIPRPNGWGREHKVYGKSWLHSDMKNMAYFYVYNLFEQLVTRGDMK